MRSIPSGWNMILAKLGFTRRKQGKQGRRNPLQKRLRMERLEDRRVLSITVDTFLDERDFNITTDGDISLRDAILEAPAGETINFSTNAAHGLNGATINLLPTLGEIAVSKSLTIDASMLSLGLTIDASQADPTPNSTMDDGDFFNDGDGIRIFKISRPDPFDLTPLPMTTIKGLTLTGGDVNGAGGAIYSLDPVTLIDCVITDNHATQNGGGVSADLGAFLFTEFEAGTLIRLENTRLSGNTSLDKGGGLYVSESDTGNYNSHTIEIVDSTFTDNSARGGGGLSGRLLIDCMLTVTGSLFENNTASQGGGMLLDVRGRDTGFTLANSTITQNHAVGLGALHPGTGGGIYLDLSAGAFIGDCIVTGTTVDRNEADNSGGGVFVCVNKEHSAGVSGDFHLVNSTISGNWTNNAITGQGGGIWIGGDGDSQNTLDLVLTNATMTANASAIGGGLFSQTIFDNGGIPNLRSHATNSIISGNTISRTSTAANNIAGSGLENDSEYNLIGPNSAAFPTGPGNILNGNNNPLLGPLAINGRATATHALLTGSPAIDKGSNALAIDPLTGQPLLFDQRGQGFPRIYDVPGVTNGGGGSVDMGAYEVGLDSPRVVNLTLSNSIPNSPHAPYSFNNPNDELSDADGSGIQLQTVPVGAADTIKIKFSKHVTNLQASHLVLSGLRSGTIPSLAASGGFIYDNNDLNLLEATWKFATPFSANQYVISLSDLVMDAAFNQLDGEWTNPFSIATTNEMVSEFPSGNGTAGGKFNFVFTLLPGDVSLSNTINVQDYNIFLANNGLSGATYVQGDVNGNGSVTWNDASIMGSNMSLNFIILWLADFNRDSFVNSLDVAIWQANFGTGTTQAQGDADGDGDVDGADWLILQRQNGLEITWVM